MTDTEIIKALECCAYGHKCCDVCPYDDNGFFCSDKMKKDAIDLINRQKTEIDILIRKKETLKDEIAELQAENERLQIENERFADIGKMYSEIRAEAIKEFAERLKNEIISDTAYGCDCNQHAGYYDYTIKIGDIPEYIDSLVNELTHQPTKIEHNSLCETETYESR